MSDSNAERFAGVADTEPERQLLQRNEEQAKEIGRLVARGQELEREVARLKEPLDWALANLSSYVRKDARVQSGAFVEKFRAALALVSDVNADNLLRPSADAESPLTCPRYQR